MDTTRLMRNVLLGIGLCGSIGSAGCQVEMGGMTLPSGRYLKDDVQYFAPGTDHPHANEIAALEENQGPPGR